MKKILIVDDNQQNLYMLQTLLSGNGYAVISAFHGAEALEKAKSEHPDMIISDILMPVMDGFQLCRTWKTDNQLKNIPFLFYTATYTDPKDEEFGLGLGAERYIIKPTEPDALLSILKDVFKTKTPGHIAEPREPRSDECTYMREYNEVIIRKLEDKMVQVEKANRRLEQQVAKQMRIEHQLRESDAQNRALIEAIPDMMFIINKEGVFLDFVPSSTAKPLLPPDEFLGKKISDIMPPEIAKNQMEQIRKTIETGQLQISDYVLQESESIKHYEGRMVSISDDKVLAISRDITETKQMQEQLNQSMKMEAIGRLAGGIAHDFNNALTVILAISDMMLKDLTEVHPLYPEIKEIHKAGERCSILTRQLLAFSRLQPLQMTVLNLNDVFINMEKMLVRVIGEDIEIVKFLESEKGSVKADIGQLEQILANLAVNARDAMPNGGTLTIETKDVYLDDEYANNHMDVVSGNYVMLAVSDTGEGMNSETRSKVFEPFFTTKEKGKGTGLGLASVYGIVKQSGGNIWVYSEPGKGSTFKIYLPRVEEKAEKLKEQKSDSKKSYRGSETVLLVEDEDSVREVTKRMLTSNGYTVLDASNAEQSLKICEQHPESIHLLITDMVMPGMSGTELGDHMTRKYPNMKVLYISGYTDNAIIQQGILPNATHFIQKPFTAESLLHKVSQVIHEK